MYEIDPTDEARHEAGEERFWNESWYLDFHDDAGTLGGYVRLGLCPGLGATWHWACVVGEGRPLVTAIDHAVPLPPMPSIDLAHGGLSATHHCTDALQRFEVSVETSAVALDDPADTYHGLVGKPVPLALDLVWETDGPGGYRFQQLDRYEIPCRVSGTIRVGDERIAFTGHGQRDHSWGERHWWSGARSWNAGRLDDGTRFHSVAPRTLDGQDLPWAAGYVQAPGKRLAGIHHSRAAEEPGREGLPRAGRIEVGDLHLDVEPLYFSPVLLTDPDGRNSRFPRCLARYREVSPPAARSGLGWIEWNQPQP